MVRFVKFWQSFSPAAKCLKAAYDIFQKVIPTNSSKFPLIAGFWTLLPPISFLGLTTPSCNEIWRFRSNLFHFLVIRISLPRAAKGFSFWLIYLSIEEIASLDNFGGFSGVSDPLVYTCAKHLAKYAKQCKFWYIYWKRELGGVEMTIRWRSWINWKVIVLSMESVSALHWTGGFTFHARIRICSANFRWSRNYIRSRWFIPRMEHRVLPFESGGQ